MERALASYHPIVSFLFFVVVIGMSMLYMHPVLLLISLISAIIYSTILNKEKFKHTLSFTSIIILGAIIANAMFVEGLQYYFISDKIQLL